MFFVTGGDYRYFNPRSPRGLRPSTQLLRQRQATHFNPSSPRGLRPCSPTIIICVDLFQSTQPKRAATVINPAYTLQSFISIHAAQEGCDKIVTNCSHISLRFQSTQPKRAATANAAMTLKPRVFQSTQPKRAAT